MSSELAQCPICSCRFQMSSINRHIDNCLLNTQDSDGTRISEGEPEKVSPVRKRARISPEWESEVEPGLPTSPKPPGRTGQLDRSGEGKSEVTRADKTDGSDPRKKMVQWGSLLRPNARATKLDSGPTPGKKKAKPTGGYQPQLSRSSQIPSSSTGPPAPSPSPSPLPSANRSVEGPARTSAKTEFRPLAERVRPADFDDFVGQDEAVGRQSILRRLLEEDVVPSLIFWGPPGCGKTTLANIIARRAKLSGKARFVSMSATQANVATVKDAIAAAANEQRMTRRQTILFIDEIHRFNKMQQDTFLPHVENGTITLIGATTENPSFKINSALLSRCRVIVLQKLGVDELLAILRRAAVELGVAVVEEGEETRLKEGLSEDNQDENEGTVCIETTALTYLANLCDGDARSALNTLQMVVESRRSSRGSIIREAGQSHAASDDPGTNRPSSRPQNANKKEVTIVNGASTRPIISTSHVKQALQRTHVMYDREGDEHYNCISALHKSMRGSDANAALYWLARMLIGGEDPLYIARRLIAFASEDVGLADPLALTQAVSAHQACQFLGIPACEVVLAQCVIYLSKAPKSSVVECSLMEVKRYIQEYEGAQPGVPLHLRPGSTRLMRDLGHGKGYVHSAAAGDQGFLPDCLGAVDFFKNADLVL